MHVDSVYSQDMYFNWKGEASQIRLSTPLPLTLWNDQRHSYIFTNNGKWSGSFSYIGENRWQRPALHIKNQTS